MGSMNRQLAYLQQLNRQHRLLVVFFEDADMKTYIASPAKDTEGYYRHVIAEKFAFEKRLDFISKYLFITSIERFSGVVNNE